MGANDQSPALPCPVCRSPAARVCRRGLYDDRYGYPGLFDLRACDRCGHRFLDASFSDDELGRLYTKYYPRSTVSLDRWRPHPEMGAFWLWWHREKSAVFRWVPRDCRVLDVGCGFGESLGYHRSRGCDAQGIEADENIRRVGHRFGLNVRVGLFRAADYPAGHFDCVTLDQVIEHSSAPVQLLTDVAAVLRPGGIAFLSTPNAESLTAALFGRRWVHLHTPYHLQLFCRESLVVAAESAGLQVKWIRHITQPRWYGFQWLHLLAYPEPNAPSIFWQPGKSWPPDRLVARKIISGLGRLGLNHLVAWILDSCRQGDNWVVALYKRE